MVLGGPLASHPPAARPPFERLAACGDGCCILRLQVGRRVPAAERLPVRPSPLLDGALELPPAAGETDGRCACCSLRLCGGRAGARGSPCGHVRSSRRARGPASCCTRLVARRAHRSVRYAPLKREEHALSERMTAIFALRCSAGGAMRMEKLFCFKPFSYSCLCTVLGRGLFF